MKTSLLTLALALGSLALPAQNAVDFTANDCAGNGHNLFSELNAGKVIVIAWVMPCASCVAPTQTASTVVQSYTSTNPGQVLLYVVDDYGNTNCNTLNNWVSSNGIQGATTFSSSAISMSAYGTAGMPKIVVVGGGYGHGLYFNENNAAANNQSGIQEAIDSALADVTGVIAPVAPAQNISIYPSPAVNSTTVTVNAATGSKGTIQVFNALGELVITVYDGTFQPGENRFAINTESLAAGNYFIRVKEGEVTSDLKFSIVK